MNNGQSELDTEVYSSHEENLDRNVQSNDGFAPSKAYKILNLIPTMAFAVFAVLMTLFAVILPVANIRAFGLKEKYGTLLNGTRFNEIHGLNALSIAIIIVALVTLIYTVILLQYKFSSLKYRSICGKPVYKLLESISLVFVLAFTVFAISTIGLIKNADEGIKIIRVGAYPILTIIVSVLALIAIVGSIILTCVYEKTNPEVMEMWATERQNAKGKKKASLAKKVASRTGKKYSKYLIMSVVLVAVILLGGTSQLASIVQRFNTKSFDKSALLKEIENDAGKLELGKSQIEIVLGESYVPQGSTADSKNVVYYTENYLELLNKMELNQKYGLLAIEQGDSRISGLLKQARNLEEEVETIAYGKAEITYNDYSQITKVVYNNVVIDGMGRFTKKLESVKVFGVNEKYVDNNYINRKIDRVVYLAKYTDGSFIYGTCENAELVLEDNTTSAIYEGSCAGKTIKWQDEFGTYQAVAPANNN